MFWAGRWMMASVLWLGSAFVWRCRLSCLVISLSHFFDRPKKRDAKKVARLSALRLALRRSPRNKSKLASRARSDRDLFCSWLWLRARDDEPRKAGGLRYRLSSWRHLPNCDNLQTYTHTNLRTLPLTHLHTFRLSYVHTAVPGQAKNRHQGKGEPPSLCLIF
jgi:hypothetical protein